MAQSEVGELAEGRAVTLLMTPPSTCCASGHLQLREVVFDDELCCGQLRGEDSVLFSSVLLVVDSHC